MLALVSHQRGDVDATRRWVLSTLSRSKAQGYPYWLALAQIFDAWLAAHEGGARSGAMEVADSIAKYSATGARIGLSCVLLLEAEIEQRLGDVDRAVATVNTALDHIESSGEHYYTAEVYRRQGELYLACSEPLLAEQAFVRGLNIARSQGALSWELSAAISLARLWSAQGQQEHAYSLLTQVYDTFTEGFTTADLRAAAQLRSQLAPGDGGRELPGIVDQVDQNVRST
jgi:predicted ATPase